MKYLMLAILLALAPAASAADDLADRWTQEDFAITDVRAQKAWIGDAPAPGTWQPAAQPDLAQALAAAPKLELEDVAPPPYRCWTGHLPYIVPNPDGESWDMAFPYYNKYRGEQEVIIHDFGSGETTRQVLSTGKGESILTKAPIGFHMQPSYYAAGKLIFEVYGVVTFVVYDPAENAFTHASQPFGKEVVNGRCVLGEDGMIYGMGWPKDKSGFVAYRFNPETMEAKRWPTFGPPNKHRAELYRGVTKRGDWIYADIGNRPWHLVAFNVETGEGKLLAATKDIRGSGSTIGMGHVEGGLRGSIAQPAFIDGMGEVDMESFDFWLRDGKIMKREGEVPPWSNEPAKGVRRGTRVDGAREFQVWPDDFKPKTAPPEIKRDAGDPDPNGHVTLPYRLPGQKEWQTLEYDVKMYPGVVKHLTEVNDHVLFAVDSGYGQHVFYNMKTNRLIRVSGTLSPYSMTVYGERLYVSGYPTSQMFGYDFTRPLGREQENPNPWRLGYIGKKDDTHCPLGGTVGCADGRVYNGGTTYGRRRVGGGFGWYDTKTKEVGGMPFDGHRVFWMTAAADGRFLLLSTKHGGQGQLFCWDTQAEDFAYKKPLLGAATPGPLEEVLPGLVMGHTTLPDKKGAVLYGLAPATGEVLWTKPVPAGPVTGYGQIRTHAYTFRRGPRGYVWATMGDALVKIDPRDATVSVVGKTEAQQLGFVQGQVFLSGGSKVRRLKGVRTDAD